MSKHMSLCRNNTDGGEGPGVCCHWLRGPRPQQERATPDLVGPAAWSRGAGPVDAGGAGGLPGGGETRPRHPAGK